MKSVHNNGYYKNPSSGQFRNQESRGQLFSQPMPINANAITSNPDMTASSIKILGMTVSGVDPRLINNVKIMVDVPLKPGKKNILGFGDGAHIQIKKDTAAVVSLELKRDRPGSLALRKFHVAFTRSLTIENPASSFKSDFFKSETRAAIADKIADLQIKDIIVDEYGEVFVDGQVKLLGLIKKRLPRYINTINVPKLDESLWAALGLNQLGSDINALDRAKELMNNFDVKKMLCQLGTMANNADFSIKISGDDSEMSFLKNNHLLKGPKKALDINLKGMIDLDTQGDLLIMVDKKLSKVSCSLGSYHPHVEMSVHNLDNVQPVAVDVMAAFKGASCDLSVDMFSSKRVKDVLPRNKSINYHAKKLPMEEVTFNIKSGGSTIDLDVNILAHADLFDDNAVITGSISGDAKINNPFAKAKNRGVTMDGNLASHFNVDNLKYVSSFGLMNGVGDVTLTINPSKKNLQKFPELQSSEFKYKIDLLSHGQARIIPPEFGLSRFFRPVKNYEGHDERIDGSLTKGPLYSIGSKEYFDQVKKITGAHIRRTSDVTLLIDGSKSMPERIKAINEAKNYIFFQTLMFKDDESGWLYAKALAAAAQRGVQVQGIVDSLGNVGKIDHLMKPHPIYEYLRQNGVRVLIYNDALENGLREIFNVAKKHAHVFKISDPSSISGMDEILTFFETVVKACDDKHSLLSKHERNELKNAIRTMFSHQEGVSGETAVNELRHILRDNMTALEEILLLMKRMGNASYRSHEKYLIVDHQTAIVGGMNITDEDFKSKWRDTDVMLKGEIVDDVYQTFCRNWFNIAHEKIDASMPLRENEKSSPSHLVSLIHHRPFEDGDHKIVNYLLYNLRTLQKGERAWFETAYFLPRGVLRTFQRELVRAAKRGVDVRIITNSETSSDFPPLVLASIFDVRELLEAKARVFTRNNNKMVHAKVMVLGDILTMVGSWNCDNRSASHDSEDVCTIYSRDINRKMTDILMKDMFEQSNEVNLADVVSQSLGKEIRSASLLLAGEII